MWGWYQYFTSDGINVSYARDKRKFRAFGTTKPKYNFDKVKAKRKAKEKSKRKNRR